MPTETDTYARLVQFFTTKPSLMQKISDEPSHPAIWEEIFFYFFESHPQDDPNKTFPDYWRPGSTDPRWDTLLYKENLGAMRALEKLIKDWRDNIVLFPPHKEAA